MASSNETAATPFQEYTGTAAPTSDTYGTSNTGSFVAPINGEQATAGNNIGSSAQEAQPYYSAATGDLNSAQAQVNPVNSQAEWLTSQAAGAVNATPLTGQQISQYMNPYVQDVAGSTAALLGQNNAQAQSGALGNAISSGAFGGDRTGLAAANLEQQQNLSNANTYANIFSTGYTNAQGVAQQQQGVNLAAGQANRSAELASGSQLASIGNTAYGEGANTASELGSLGTGAQAAGLAGANAELGYGTLEQQTQQAADTANYNQFEQQQSYPYQVGSWLAGISEGTGSLEGSSTTTSQPGGFFSDERLKEDIKEIGETHDGQKIYSYKMKGDPRTRVGLLAQEVEKKHPEAVGLAAGFKTVDYDKATREAANEKHFYRGGVVPMRRTAKAGGGGTDMDSILAEQAQMYQGLAGGNKQASYVPQGSSGSHQLAVANAPAAGPPPSGISKVNQSIGLGQKGYQAYHHFANGANPGVSGGTDPEYLDAAQSSLDSQGVGLAAPAADSSTASGLASTGAVDATAGDAAAGAAGDAAAGAGADAAAGAVAGAAGGAAADGAADAAAALAAEYAAADIGVAALAAKRGGVVRRHRDGGGGTPYEGGVAGEYGDDDGGMDIPGQAPTTHKLNAAPAAGKQPTGLQTLMDLGTQQGATSAIGGMFSNEALKRGGVARIGKDDGGALSDDSTMDPIEVDSTSPAPVAYTGGIDPGAPMYRDAPDTPTLGDGAASKDPDVSDKGSWWDRNKGNVIPLAQGLAAMGTAKTRSLGTALATGLGAAADSYVPTQEGLAKANLTTQEGRVKGSEADMLSAANQVAIPAMRSAAASTPALAPVSAGAPTAARPVAGATPYQPQAAAGPQGQQTSLPDQLRAKYYNPPLTDAEAQRVQQMNAVTASTKNPYWKDMAEAGPTNRVKQTAYANQQDAQDNYDKAVETYNATKDTNPAIAGAAAATADAYRQYTGDTPITGAGGVQLNSRTTEPFIGRQAQRLSPEAYTQLATQLDQKVDMPAGDAADPGKTIQVPGYRKMGFQTRKEAIDSLVPPGTPDVPGAPAGGVQRPPGTAPSPVATRAPVRAPVQAAPPVATAAPLQRPGQPTAPVNGIPAPLVQKAFTDPTYFPPKGANQPGTTFGSATKEKSDAEAKRSVALQDFSSETATSSGTAMQYIDAAQKILNSKGAPVTGAWGGAAKQISRILGTADASNYENVSKQLINLAVQSGKSNFPNATQKEVGIQLEQASPATDQTGPALRDLLSETKRITQYNLDTSNLALKYLDNNGKALRFGDWNQEYHPRSETVNQTPAPAAALQYLKAHPEAADHFKAKYGYVPQ